LKILFGVVSLLAILAIAQVWKLDRGWTIIGGLVIIVFAFVLLILAGISQRPNPILHRPAIVLIWFSTALFILWCGLLTGCVFFQWPIPVRSLPLLPPPEPVVPAATSLEVRLYNGPAQEGALLGTTRFFANEHESVQVRVKLSSPRAFFLLALNPDGQTQLLYRMPFCADLLYLAAKKLTDPTGTSLQLSHSDKQGSGAVESLHGTLV
jgi:hypothetical protein